MAIKNSTQSDLQKNPESYWIASTSETNFPPLTEDLEVDVAIIGGGIAGLTSAYLLKQEGLTVALLEADRIIKGTTGHTTAKVTSQHHLIYDQLIKDFGLKKAKQYADANEGAIDLIEELSEKHGIDCDFSRLPAYVYTQSDTYIEKLKKEVKAASDLGLNAGFLEELPLPFPIKGAMVFHNQAQFHPRKYLLGLAKEIPGNGSAIFEGTEAVEIEEGQPCSILTRDGNNVRAKNVIVASHFPFHSGLGLFFAKMYTERSYIVGIKIKNNFPEGMFISAESPTRSLRAQRDQNEQLILVGGDNHKTAHGQDTRVHYNNLLDFSELNFDVESVPYHWSAQDCMPPDKVPYIGNLSQSYPHIYVATGFKKWGMTNGTASAMILTDLIVKGESPWASVFNPSRLPSASAATKLIGQNLHVGSMFISGKLSSGSKEIDIQPGEGKVIQYDHQRVGAYREDNGELYLVDTTCTHLGCELKWNAAEKTWDCPCHGSRFSYKGEIVEGPATKPLRQIKD